MPLPHGTRISFFEISSTVLFELTSNKFDSRYCELVPGSPATRKREHLSASVRIPTFCKILWHKLLTSRSLQMSLTSSRMSSVSSKLCKSVRDFFLIWPVSSLVQPGWVKNVGVPSTVVTQGLVRPPFSNSCAEIFLTGVAPPEQVDLDPVERDLKTHLLFRNVYYLLNVTNLDIGVEGFGSDPSSDRGERGWVCPGGSEWATNQESIIWRLALRMR